MLLQITLTQPPATDLGYLLHKHPDRCQRFDLAFGAAHVLYPEATDARCTAALILDIDAVVLSRGHPGEALEPYVNDRPYLASSYLSVAIATVFSSALSGTSRDRPQLVDQPLPLQARVASVPCRGDWGESLLRRLFEPLGYAVATTAAPIDDRFPEWGTAACVLELAACVPLRDLLSHLYVLLPALDGAKHYWIGDDEVAKLLRHGERWLATHPEKAWIARRYLKSRGNLLDVALERLAPDDQEEPTDNEERPVRLNDQRVGAVLAALRGRGARSVIDLGCGSGWLIEALLRDPSFERVAGMDVSHRALEVARERTRQADRLTLIHGSLCYRDRRLEGFDAAVLVEVIEHLDPDRLRAAERVVFEFARPSTVVVTTPNAEYNVRFDRLDSGAMRHPDHRFEWTRAQLEAWASDVASRHGYSARFMPVGPLDETVGAPTQMAIFEVLP